MSVTGIRWRNCRGVTLTELLVGVAIGGIVLVGVVTAWGISVRSSAYMAEATRLHHDLRSTMQVVAHDLRRADGGVNMPNNRAVRFNADGSCVTYYVDGQVRGFRLFDGAFQMYFNNDPLLLVPPSCTEIVPPETEAGWVSLYDSLAEGGFAVTGFQAAWRAICYPFDETADVEVFDSLADASVYQRCVGMTDVTEVLQVTLTLDGTIATATTPKSLSLRDVVTLRNNDVR
jgi:prepilin-type N-terminal cleavage/methylation domain-containing protein